MTLMILLIIVSVKQFHSVEFLIPDFKKSVLQKFQTWKLQKFQILKHLSIRLGTLNLIK